MGNMISGSNCTIVMLGMNTPIDPATLERPPLNLAIAVDLSGSMAGEPIERLRNGLQLMLDELEPEDRVTLVGFHDGAEIIVESLGPDAPELAAAIEGLSVEGATNIYAGLRLAFETVDAYAELLRTHGFVDVQVRALTFGMAWIVQATKEGLPTAGVGDPAGLRLDGGGPARPSIKTRKVQG